LLAKKSILLRYCNRNRRGVWKKEFLAK